MGAVSVPGSAVCRRAGERVQIRVQPRQGGEERGAQRDPGVKGNCDTDKLVRQQKEKAKAEVKKNTTDVLDQKTAGLKEGKSQLQGTQQKVNQAGQQLKQTQQDVKAVAKDPLKAAATAVINQG